MPTTPRPLAIEPTLVDKFRARRPGSIAVAPDAILDGLEAAMTTAKAKADQIAAIEEAVADDATMPAPARATKIRDAALRLGEAAGAALDAAQKKIVAELDTIAKATSAPPPPKHNAQMATEVRSRLAGMSPKDRGELIAKAIDSSDDLVLHAALAAPAFLSGFSPAELEIRRAAWRKTHHAEAVDREDRLKRALEAAERAGLALVSYVGKVADAGAAAKSDAAAKKAAEALAAAS